MPKRHIMDFVALLGAVQAAGWKFTKQPTEEEYNQWVVRGSSTIKLTDGHSLLDIRRKRFNKVGILEDQIAQTGNWGAYRQHP